MPEALYSDASASCCREAEEKDQFRRTKSHGRHVSIAYRGRLRVHLRNLAKKEVVASSSSQFSMIVMDPDSMQVVNAYDMAP
jgi:hypothetical protein